MARKGGGGGLFTSPKHPVGRREGVERSNSWQMRITSVHYLRVTGTLYHEQSSEIFILVAKNNPLTTTLPIRGGATAEEKGNVARKVLNVATTKLKPKIISLRSESLRKFEKRKQPVKGKIPAIKRTRKMNT